MLKRKANRNSVPDDQLELLEERSGGKCEICKTRSAQRTESGKLGPHHIERRRTRNHDVSNLLALCWKCHGEVHRFPEWAYDNGFMKRTGRPWRMFYPEEEDPMAVKKSRTEREPKPLKVKPKRYEEPIPPQEYEEPESDNE